MYRGQTQARSLTTLQRRARVFQLRAIGLSYRTIVHVMTHDPAWRGRLPRSYNERRAHSDVAHEFARQRTVFSEETANFRVLEGERLDAMQVRVWSRAVSGDLQAIDRVLRIMERRAKLYGLDAPTKIAPTTPAGGAVPVTQGEPVNVEAVAQALARYGQALRDYDQTHHNGAQKEYTDDPSSHHADHD